MEGLARSLARAVENALAAFIARTASGHFSGSWWLLALFVSIVAFALTWFIARRVGVTAKWSLGASAVVAGLALLGVAEFQGGNESWMTEQLLQGRAGDAIRASLADPNSAKIEFTAVQFGPEATICGVLNARGRGGGYQGARPFAVRFEAGRSQPALYIERENDGLSFGVGPGDEPLEILGPNQLEQTLDAGARCGCEKTRERAFDCERRYFIRDGRFVEYWTNVERTLAPADTSVAP